MRVTDGRRSGFEMSSRRVGRRPVWRLACSVLTAVSTAVAVAATFASAAGPPTGEVNRTNLAVSDDEVVVGSIRSLTGTIAIVETSVLDAERLAIEQINAAGGVLGRRVKLVAEDGASDWPTFAEKSRKLLQQDHAAAVFGCYTSASRKAVLPIFEQYKGLLYYPTYYEGLEQSANVIYTGAEATQQSIAAVEWAIKKKGWKKVYLFGSDYIWPRTTNKIARKAVEQMGGEVVGEEYLPLGHTQFGSLINKIKLKKPDVVLSTLVGGSNVAYYKQAVASGLNGAKQPTIALAVTEEEISGIGAENIENVYSVMGYFQLLDNPVNKKFVADFKARYGSKRPVGDTMEAAYIAPFLWKMAVEKAGSFDVEKVVAASGGLEMDAPEGKVHLDEANHHLWKYTRVGKVRSDGLIDIVFETPLIKPDPFPKGYQ
jgi:urea transport system substrate-binding protein